MRERERRVCGAVHQKTGIRCDLNLGHFSSMHEGVTGGHRYQWPVSADPIGTDMHYTHFGYSSDVDPNYMEHMSVLKEALEIHQSRTRKYGDMWKEYGWQGTLFHARNALRRAWRNWFHAELMEEVDYSKSEVDDLLDTINYCVLTIRAIREKNRGGWFDA